MHWQHCWFNVLSWHTNHGIGSSKQQNYPFTTAKMFFTIIWINVYKCLTISDFDKLIFDWLGGACVPASAIVCKCVYIAIDGIQTYIVTWPNHYLVTDFWGREFLFFFLTIFWCRKSSQNLSSPRFFIQWTSRNHHFVTNWWFYRRLLWFFVKVQFIGVSPQFITKRFPQVLTGVESQQSSPLTCVVGLVYTFILLSCTECLTLW